MDLKAMLSSVAFKVPWAMPSNDAIQLAESDANKNAIIDMGGLDRLMKLSSRFSEDPSTQQEEMTIITALSLRSAENSVPAIEAGAGDLVIQAMQKFPTSQMQRQACFMIRNLVVRNPENRYTLSNFKRNLSLSNLFIS